MKASAKSHQPKNTDKPVDIKESEQTPVDEDKAEVIPEPNISDLIPAKAFVKKLEEEFKDEHLPKHLLSVFKKIVPPVDTEENYRKVWKNTFKRQ